MKYAEFLKLSSDELVLKFSEEKSNLTKLKFAHAISPIEDASRISKIRKNIARMHTALAKRRKELSVTKTNAHQDQAQ